MKILKIEIEEFGKLSDRLFLPGEGLNLIQGPNESGKSTLLAFIRFIFYGFPRRSGAEAEERDKRLSWHTGRAAGRIHLRTGAGDFSVFRSVVRQGSTARESHSETLSVTSLTSGEEVNLNGLTPGEHFLGLSAALYDSTLCLRQSDAARVSEPGTSVALSELLFTGSAGVSADTALEKLRLARRDLRHQKGRGGRIADLEDRIASTQDTLLRAREDSGALSAVRADVSRYRTQVLERRKELESISSDLEMSSIAQTLELFDRARDAGALCDQKKLNYEAALAQSTAVSTLPQALTDVRESLHERELAQAEARQALPELERMRNVRHNEKLLAAHALLVEKGGAQNVLTDYRKTQSRRKRASKLACFFVIAGAILTGALILLLPYLLPLEKQPLGVGMLSASAALLFAFLTFLFLVRAIRAGKRARAWLKRLGVPEPRMFRTYLEQCSAEAQDAEAHRTLLTELENAFSEKQGRVSRAEQQVRARLAEAGVQTPEDIEAVPALLTHCEEHYRAAQDSLLAAKSEWERAYAAWEGLSCALKGKNEAELRARYTRASTYDPDELRRKQAFLSETLSGLEKKAAEAERRESALAVTAKDPASAEGELAALRAEHRSATQRLDAIELALSALESAMHTLREGVIPTLCEKASAHMRLLTGGTYQKIYTGEDLSVRLDSDKGPLPLSHFSAGCRDAAHLSLRLGLLDTLAKESLPLLLDEAFSRLDDDRAKALLHALLKHCRAGGQCLLFTCHSREAVFLAGEDFTHFELQ